MAENQLLILLLAAAGITCLVSAGIISFVKRKEGVTIAAVFWKGSFIYRELEQYVSSPATAYAKGLVTAGVVLVLMAVLLLVVAGAQ